MISVTDKNFESSVVEGLNVIDFYTEYCVPCQAFAPILEQLSEENKSVNFLKVNAASERQTSRKFKVMSAPTIIFYKNNEVLEVIHGVRDIDFMQDLINKYM